MGTLVFMPWTVLARPCMVGEFELAPVLIEPRLRDDREWMTASQEMVGVLRAYQTPPNIPLRSATLVRRKDRDSPLT